MVDAVDEIIAMWAREKPDLDATPMGIVGRISRLSRLLDKELKDFFAGHGLEFWEFDVLATLRRSGAPYELSAGALLKTAMVTSGAITNRVDRMETKGLVLRVRDPDDRRGVRIRLTPDGLALIDKLMPLHVANEQRLLAELGEGDQDTLADLLRTLAASLGDTSLG
ncbi:transcriptional regulator, MarR family [Catenulispora acidiphila DSM 44928]|uniref:Transcriptional regulator, MarR family n=1 Tax=Catenulispora acidiphila (strain DSM 44928 / JCM 14897 / NBRC 102108 / NRRL B-24433 / ID139908) TaxID=479433 RepID=C7PZV8_CATAD|nr:MarR family transcriptional regulator [Catenulispora acidiphila]ACU73623.1 transcriptional regulator, MarR family [Catenulispora acidiphila DSM 44928]